MHFKKKGDNKKCIRGKLKIPSRNIEFEMRSSPGINALIK